VRCLLPASGKTRLQGGKGVLCTDHRLLQTKNTAARIAPALIASSPRNKDYCTSVLPAWHNKGRACISCCPLRTMKGCHRETMDHCYIVCFLLIGTKGGIHCFLPQPVKQLPSLPLLVPASGNKGGCAEPGQPSGIHP